MAGNNDFISTLEQEEDRLFDELGKNPVFARNPGFQRLMKLHTLRSDYRQMDVVVPAPKPESKPARPAKPPKRAKRTAKGLFQPKPTAGSAHGSKTKEIVAAAVSHFRKTQQRATSGELVKALSAMGVEVGGKNPGSSMSAFMSNSPRLFDNVKGEGYGLREWAAPANGGAPH